MKKLKIAIVVNRFYPEVGGAETNLFFQANELAKHHDVTIFTPRRLADTKKFEEKNGYKIFRLKDVLNLKNRFPNMATDTLMPSVFLKILGGNFDLVQVFPSMNKNSMLAMLAAKLRRIPFVLCSFDLLDYAKILAQSGKIDAKCLDHFEVGKFRANLLSKCDHIFAISNREIQFFKRHNKSVSYSPVPIKLEEYKTDTNSDVRRKYDIAPETMLYFCLGRVSKLKGQDLALKAFAKIAKEIPDSKMAIVGRLDYEPQFVADMRKFADENAISDRVIFTGMVEREEVIAFLKQGDVHIIPVRFMNSGAVVVETWAAGTPVIQSDAVDPNYVEDNLNGWIFCSENIEEIAEKMRIAYAKRSDLRKMGEAGRRYVLENLTYQNLTQIYEDEFKKLIKKLS